MVNRVHLLCLVIHLLKAAQNSCVGSVRKLNFNRKLKLNGYFQAHE